MTSNDILDQEKLKAQCAAAIDNIALRNEYLSKISEVFVAGQQMEDSGKSADAIKNQCKAYVSLIKAMVYANEYDSADHAALNAMLGGGAHGGYLDGAYILERISAEKTEELNCASRAADCRNKAYSTDDPAIASHWYSEASYWDGCSDNHRRAWQYWCAKRDFFDSVQEKSRGFFQNSISYREYVNQGMEAIAFSFSNGTYNIPDTSEWQQGIEKLNEKFEDGIEEVAKGLLDKDGKIDIDKTDKLLSKKINELTPYEYEIYQKLVMAMKAGATPKELEESLQIIAGVKKGYAGNKSADFIFNEIGKFGALGSYAKSIYKLGDGIAKGDSNSVAKSILGFAQGEVGNFGKYVSNAYSDTPNLKATLLGDFTKGGAVSALLKEGETVSSLSKGQTFLRSFKSEMDYLPKLVGKNATVAKNLKVATKWGGVALSAGVNYIDNMEEMKYDPTMSKTRAKAETAIETGVDLFIGAAATAIVTTAVGTALPAVAVGAIAVGAVWAIDIGVEWLTEKYQGEKKDTAEVVSDTILDWIGVN